MLSLGRNHEWLVAPAPISSSRNPKAGLHCCNLLSFLLPEPRFYFSHPVAHAMLEDSLCNPRWSQTFDSFCLHLPEALGPRGFPVSIPHRAGDRETILSYSLSLARVLTGLQAPHLRIIPPVFLQVSRESCPAPPRGS